MPVIPLLALLAITPAFTVDTIVVGHPSLRNVSLTLGTDTTEIFVTQNGSRRLVSTSTVSVARQGDTYVVVFMGQTKGGMAIDSVVLSASTLAPVRHAEVMTDHRAWFAFRDGQVTGQRDSAGVTTPIARPVGAERFDFSVLQHIMDRLPLATGYSAVIRAYDVALGMERDVRLQVVGRERLMEERGPIDAWKTVVDFGSHQVTRWIAVAGQREVRWEIARQGMIMEGRTRRP